MANYPWGLLFAKGSRFFSYILDICTSHPMKANVSRIYL